MENRRCAERRRPARCPRTDFWHRILPHSMDGSNGGGLWFWRTAENGPGPAAWSFVCPWGGPDARVHSPSPQQFPRRPAAMGEAADRTVFGYVVLELHEISAVVALPADDARPCNHAPGFVRLSAGAGGKTAHYLRPCAVVLLPAAHPAHPRRRCAARPRPLRPFAASHKRSMGRI